MSANRAIGSHLFDSLLPNVDAVQLERTPTSAVSINTTTFFVSVGIQMVLSELVAVYARIVALAVSLHGATTLIASDATVTDRSYFTTVALTSSPQGPTSPRVPTQRAW